MSEVTIAMNNITYTHEIRFHAQYETIPEDCSCEKEILWNTFLKFVSTTLEQNKISYCVFRFAGYRLEGDYDLVLQFYSNVHYVSNYRKW